MHGLKKMKLDLFKSKASKTLRFVRSIHLKDQSFDQGSEDTFDLTLSLKRGTGFRSSFSGNVTTVFGASGLIGRSVCNKLGQSGSQIIVPYRGDIGKNFRLKLCGDLGQVLFSPFDLNSLDSIRNSMKYSNQVINLIGQNNSTRNFDLYNVHVEGAARIARLAKECGVEKFIHLSHVNAREFPEKIFSKNGSEFLRTKWLGEQAVLKEFPNATILRCTDVYGCGFSFIYNYLHFARRGLNNSFPMWKKGDLSIKNPVYYKDVGEAISRVIEDNNSKGKIYEIYGPESYKLGDIVQWMHEKTERANFKMSDISNSPYFLAKLFLFSYLPFGNAVLGNATLERFERDHLCDEILGYPSLESLGIVPSNINVAMSHELEVYSSRTYFIPNDINDCPEETNLKPLTSQQKRNLFNEWKMIVSSNKFIRIGLI